MHFFGASAMILNRRHAHGPGLLHAAYKYPREMNWMSGVVLLLFTLEWASPASSSAGMPTASGLPSSAPNSRARPRNRPVHRHAILAGDNIGGATLTASLLHVFIFPAFIFAGIGLHMLLVIRHGISEMPRPASQSNRQLTSATTKRA